MRVNTTVVLTTQTRDQRDVKNGRKKETCKLRPNTTDDTIPDRKLPAPTSEWIVQRRLFPACGNTVVSGRLGTFFWSVI